MRSVELYVELRMMNNPTFLRARAKRENRVKAFVLAVLIFSAVTLWTINTITLYMIVSSVCFLFCLFQIVKKRRVFSILLTMKFVAWLTVVFALIIIDAYIRTRYGKLNVDFMFFTWVSILMVMVLLLSIDGTDAMIDVVCNASEIAAIAICSYVFIADRGAHLVEYNRYGSVLSGNEVYVCIYLGYCLLGILHKYMMQRRVKELIVLLLVFTTMLLTGSKSTFTISISLIYLFISEGKPTKKIRRFLLVVISAVAVTIVVFNNKYLYSAIGYRTLSFLNNIGFNVGNSGMYSNSTHMRLSLLLTAYKCFIQNPILGGGYGAVAANPPYYLYSHCNYLELLACYGLIGCTIFYSQFYIQNRWIKRIEGAAPERYYLKAMLINAMLVQLTQITYTAGWLNYLSLIVVSSYVALRRTY